MKTDLVHRSIAVVAVACIFAAPLRAATPPSPTGDLAVIEQFLCLSDSDLEQMARAIGRLRAMSPAERAMLRQEICRYRQLPAGRRAQLRQGWGGASADTQAGWREMMQAATPERHAEIQAKLQSLPPEEKTAYRRKLVEDYRQAENAKKLKKHE